MTDLIEHTGQTRQNGYASNLPVWQLNEAVEPLQYAAIRSAHPAFSWIVPGKTGGTRQTAYRVIVADNREDAAFGRGNLWDSGMIRTRAVHLALALCGNAVGAFAAGELLRRAYPRSWLHHVRKRSRCGK